MDQLEKLAKLHEIINDGRVTADEVVQLFQALAEIMNRIKEEIDKMLGGMGKRLSDNETKILSDYLSLERSVSSKIESLKKDATQDYTKLAKEVRDELKSFSETLSSFPDLEDLMARLEIEENKELDPSKVRDSLEILRGDERLDKSAIKGLDELERDIKKKTGQSVTLFGANNGIDISIDGVSKGNTRYINLVAGTGITFAFNRVGERNDITISASSSGSFSILTATGTIDESNTAFTFASLPQLIVINGASYQQTGGAITWSWNAGTLTATLSSPVGTGGNLYGIG